jgi:hypothetical protein
MWTAKKVGNQLGAAVHLRRLRDLLAVEVGRLKDSDDAGHLTLLVIDAPLRELRRKLKDKIAAYDNVRRSPTSKITAEAGRHLALEAIARGWPSSVLAAGLYLRKMFGSLKDADNWASVNYSRARKRSPLTKPSREQHDT